MHTQPIDKVILVRIYLCHFILPVVCLLVTFRGSHVQIFVITVTLYFHVSQHRKSLGYHKSLLFIMCLHTESHFYLFHIKSLLFIVCPHTEIAFIYHVSHHKTTNVREAAEYCLAH